ncbi:MAG: hypothetical protein ACYDCD_12875 [Candidatus Acidiferrales bacterium]
MQVLSAAEVNEWFAKFPHGNTEYVQCDERGLFFADPEANCIEIEYPPKLERLPFLARYLAIIGYEDWDFRGALLWFTDWGVWNALDEGPGYRIIEAMHRAVGQPKSFEIAPGHSFRADELQDAIGMLLQPMVFGWDANYVPRWSYGTDQFFLHVSRDSFVSIVTRTKEFYDKAFGLLEGLDLKPKTGNELQVRRFCRVR